MRLYKSKRFAVYGQQGGGSMHIVRYNREGRGRGELHKYTMILKDEDQSMIIDILNTELGADVDAFLGAFTAIEGPFDADSI